MGGMTSTSASPGSLGPDLTPRIAAISEATSRLHGAMAAVDPNVLREPSLLPGWTVGHVLTHLARNADAQRNLLRWAATGEPTPMYPSRDARNADIEAGGRRAPEEILADADASADCLAAAIDDLPVDAWRAVIDTGAGGPVAANVVLDQRLAEVELHHHDLGVDAGLALLTPEAGGRLLAAVLQTYARTRDAGSLLLIPDGGEPVAAPTTSQTAPTRIAGPAASIAGWLAGRSDGTDLQCDGPLPDLPAW